MGRTYVDYVRQQLNRMQTIRNELESVHRDAEVRSEPLTSNKIDRFGTTCRRRSGFESVPVVFGLGSEQYDPNSYLKYLLAQAKHLKRVGAHGCTLIPFTARSCGCYASH